jgi:hypothetical protein
MRKQLAGLQDSAGNLLRDIPSQQVHMAENEITISANNALHWTGIPLRSIPASELGR